VAQCHHEKLRSVVKSDREACFYELAKPLITVADPEFHNGSAPSPEKN